MRHLFVLCGPPGSGKTTLLKMIEEQQFPVTQVQRITTRKPRVEDGDQGNRSREYEFLSPEDFAGRLARGGTVNLIEWNGNLYATDLDELRRAEFSEDPAILLEDMPTAIHLKRAMGSEATVVLLFTDDVSELLRLEFATLRFSTRESVREWHRRLRLKYDNALKGSESQVPHQTWDEYLEAKVSRAIPDLAFMAGKIRKGEDVLVLANRRDQQTVMLGEFKTIVEGIKKNRVVRDYPGSYVFVLMPFKDPFNKIYRFVIKPTVERHGLRCLRGDEVFSSLDVVDDIMHHIEAAKLIITDISGGNPNVFLELGVSLKLNKELILISSDSEAPFNVRTSR